METHRIKVLKETPLPRRGCIVIEHEELIHIAKKLKLKI